MLRYFLLSILLLSCTPTTQNNKLEELKDYEGLYEYVNGTTLALQSSSPDTTLYAIIDGAKYPLYHQKADTFLNNQKDKVVFNRDVNQQVSGYSVDGSIFSLLSKEFDRMEMEPRHDIANDPNKYNYQVPADINDGLKVGDLNKEFSNSELIIEMVKNTIAYDYPDVHSTLIYKNEKLVLEEYYYGYNRSTPHQLRSATKVLYGTLLGIAIEQGFIESENELLLPYFKSQYKSFENLDSAKKELTIKDFLTYQHGMDCENNNPRSKGNEMAMMRSDDWVKYTLDLPMTNDSDKKSSYCTGIALTIGELIEIVTEQDLETFAQENLFDKLGISNIKWRFAPDSSSRLTFSQLSLTPRDMVKLAKMYLNNGKWKDEQILPKSWIDKTFSNYSSGEFGYLWEHKYIMVDGKRFDSYMASGNGGQKINIWPDLDMITVFTGGNYNSYMLYGVSTPPNRMIPNYILRASQ